MGDSMIGKFHVPGALLSVPALLVLTACASVAPPAEVYSAPIASADARAARDAALTPEAPQLRTRIALGRFSNSTRYGRALLRPGDRDPLAQQVSDMLMARLVESDRFLIFERSDLDVIEAEQALTASQESSLVGVDALIVGSVTEFGRRTEGQAGFLSSTMRQTVDATVEIRLVSVDSGLAFFSGQGVGSASNEAGEVAGFGSRAGYDGSLNDRAIAAAVDDLVNTIVSEFSDRPWRSDILGSDDGMLFIAGGPASGIAIGDRFKLERRGNTLRSRQSGLPITLPGETVGQIEVVGFFGDTPQSEGTIARLVSGPLPAESDWPQIDVMELDQ